MDTLCGIKDVMVARLVRGTVAAAWMVILTAMLTGGVRPMVDSTLADVRTWVKRADRQLQGVKYAAVRYIRQ